MSGFPGDWRPGLRAFVVEDAIAAVLEGACPCCGVGLETRYMEGERLDRPPAYGRCPCCGWWWRGTPDVAEFHTFGKPAACGCPLAGLVWSAPGGLLRSLPGPALPPAPGPLAGRFVRGTGMLDLTGPRFRSVIVPR